MTKLLWPLLSLTLLVACGKEQTAAPATSAEVASSTNVSSEQFLGSDMSKDDIGGDFTLTDAQGKPFQLSSLRGKAVILSFGFTHCPDVCPTELLTYKDALAQLGDKSKDVAVVFVSVDGERDTPELMGKYVQQFSPDFIGLTDPDGKTLPTVKQQYRIVSAKTEIKSDTEYNVDHSSGAYLLDKAGNVAVYEPYQQADAKQIAHDLNILLTK